jgi:hypothetical protein
MALTAATITRTELGLADLTISTAGTYEIGADGFNPAGALAWERMTVTSPFVHGSVEVHAVKQMATGSLLIHTYGTSNSQLNTRIGDLIAAFTQSTYRLTFTMGDQTHAWDCYRADYAVGMSKPMVMTNGKWAPVQFSFPRKPIPYLGAI